MEENKRLKIKLKNGEKFIFEPDEWDNIEFTKLGCVRILDGIFCKLLINKDVFFLIEFEEVEPSKKAPENGWFPVDERKPELEEKVIACDIHGDIFIGKRADYLGKNKFVDVHYSYVKEVAAWMPLPEAYKGAVDNG